MINEEIDVLEEKPAKVEIEVETILAKTARTF